MAKRQNTFSRRVKTVAPLQKGPEQAKEVDETEAGEAEEGAGISEAARRRRESTHCQSHPNPNERLRLIWEMLP